MKLISDQQKEEQYNYIATTILDILTDSYYAGFFLNKKEELSIREKLNPKSSSNANKDVLWILMCILKGVLNQTDDNFELPFYLSYTPPDIINRVMNQKSIFIYQLYHEIRTYHEHVRDASKTMDYRALLTQIINPDCIIKVKNRDKIINDLDMLGINLKSIYGDFDNIAKHIKGKL